MGKQNAVKGERYHLIDALRGMAMVNMLAFHLCYDIFAVYGSDISWAFLPGVVAWERFISVTFLLVSGISLNFSHHPYRRGLIVNACGLLITAITALFIPNQIVIFGVLNLIGCAMIITQALRRLFDKIDPFLGAALSLLLYAVFYGMPRGFLGFFEIRVLELPAFLYNFPPLTVLGLPVKGFFSADYFPLVPWLFLYFCGYFLWRAVKRLGAQRFFLYKVPVLDFIGRYTLWIYLIHQPVLMGICFLIFGRI